MRNALILIVLFVSLISIPQSREFLAPYLQLALNPIYRMDARNKINELTTRLEAERERGRPLPTPREFESFVAQMYSATLKPTDPWGTPYFLTGDRFNVRVGSAGPDRELGTADDLLGPRIPVHRTR